MHDSTKLLDTNQSTFRHLTPKSTPPPSSCPRWVPLDGLVVMAWSISIIADPCQYAQMKARALEAQRAREREIQLEIEVKAEHAKRLRQEEDEVSFHQAGRM